MKCIFNGCASDNASGLLVCDEHAKELRVGPHELRDLASALRALEDAAIEAESVLSRILGSTAKRAAERLRAALEQLRAADREARESKKDDG